MDDMEENEYDDFQRTDEDDDMTKAQPDLLRDIWEKVNQLGSNASSPRRGRNQKACEACRQAKIRCSATKVSTKSLSELQQSWFLTKPMRSLVEIVRRRGSDVVMGRASALILLSLSNWYHRMMVISKT